MEHARTFTHAALVSQELAGEHTTTERANIIGRAMLPYTRTAPLEVIPLLTGIIIAAYEQLDAALDTTNRVPLTNRQLKKAMQRKKGR